MTLLPCCSGRSNLVAVLFAAASMMFGASVSKAGPQEMPRLSQPQPQAKAMLQVGEELEYRVSYSFFNIGTIRFRITEQSEHLGHIVYKALTIIDSNPSMSWLANVHIRFYSTMDEQVFTYQWAGDDSSSSGVDFRTMNFDYSAGKMYYTRGRTEPGKPSEIAERETVSVSGKAQDGLSLFYYARQHAQSKRVEQIPTFIDKKEESTRINFLVKVEPMEIDASDYDVETVYFEGHAGFVGVFGMTGGFKGWFSNDDARVPIVARLKVILGSIKVELTKWNRPGWTLPRAAD